MNKLELILDMYPDEDLTVANGFDDAVIGVESLTMKLVYSVTKCLTILEESGMPYEEALEFFEYNVRSAYVGERTPIWMDDF